jgi:hypothetical protein
VKAQSIVVPVIVALAAVYARADEPQNDAPVSSSGSSIWSKVRSEKAEWWLNPTHRHNGVRKIPVPHGPTDRIELPNLQTLDTRAEFLANSRRE